MGNKEVYEKVSEKILSQIKKGVLPWQMTWKGSSSFPRNATTKRYYQGINVWLLTATAMDKGYSRNEWLTYNQARKAGGHVRKGEKSHTFVVFAKPIPLKGQEENYEEEEKRFFFLYNVHAVFNVEQCEGIKLEEVAEAPAEPIAEAERLVAGYKNKPSILNGGWNPCYVPSSDEVRMPEMSAFNAPGEYYGALFHELAHSTGHKSRMNRGLTTAFGSEPYGKEEMIAEFTASYLRAVCGIEYESSVQNSASYIKSWSKAVQEDPRMVMQSASMATKVAEYIQNQESYKSEKKVS